MGAFVVLFAVDEDAVDFLGEKIADGALDDVGLLVEAARCLVVEHLALDLFPRLEEQVEIADEVAGFFALAGGADDEAHTFGNGEFVDEGLEAFALGGVLDFAGDAAAVGERREDKVAAGDGEIGGGAGALGADGALGDLDHDLGARGIHRWDVFDRGLGGAGGGVFLFVNADDLDVGIGRRGEHVPVVEKRVLGVADVNEGGFEAGIEVLDAALVDAADHAVVGLALDFKFLEAAVDEERNPLLERLGIDDEFAVGALFLLKNREDFLEEGAVLGAFGGAGF